MDGKVVQLLEALKSEDPVDRRYAAEDLGDLGDESAALALALGLNDTDISVREAMVEGLIKIGGKTVASLMVEALRSESVTLRNHAVEVLEKLDIADLECLREQGLSSPDGDVRKFCLDILSNRDVPSHLSDNSWFQIIVNLLDDSNENIAAAAVEILGRSNRAECLPLLQERVYGSSWMQAAVIEAIAQFNGKEAFKILTAIDLNRLDPTMASMVTEILNHSARRAS